MERNRTLITAVVTAALVSVSPVHADDSTLSVSIHKLVGDGRSVAPVTITGGPPARAGELGRAPELASISCAGAAALAATWKQSAAVLAPAVTSATTLDCVAQLRGVEAKFKVEVEAPAPGLYASAIPPEVRTTAREADLVAFSWDGRTRVVPTPVRAATSAGTVTARDGRLSVALPPGNAPRLIAVALAHGERIGAAFVPVIGVTTMRVEAEPGSSVQVRIAGRWFGPVLTKGRVAELAIEVPPGVTHGVARSKDKSGFVTESVADLNIPDRSRIAAVIVSPQVRATDRTSIAVAIAGSDGRPASPTLSVVGSAEHGTLGAPESLGGGLWRVPYTAPAGQGSDRVTIRVDGDDRAGSADLAIDIQAGRPARIEVDLSADPRAPGGTLTGTARVFDATNNPVLDAETTVTLAGAPLVVTRGEVISFRGRIPERVPDGGVLRLDVRSDAAHAHLDVPVHGVPVTASVSTVVDGRRAFADIVVRDRFGNRVIEDAFEIVIVGGTTDLRSTDARALHVSVIASPRVVSGSLQVRAGSRLLATTPLHFDPPGHAVVLGVWGSGGWVDNLGALSAPRASGGLGLRRGIGGIELGLLVGAEGFSFRDTAGFMTGGATREVSRSIVSVGASIMLRGRVRLSRRFGVALAAGIVPMRMTVTLDPGDQAADEYVETVLGARAQLHGDAKLGPGRAFFGVSYGRARLSKGVVTGEVEGPAILGGYEWWFASFGS